MRGFGRMPTLNPYLDRSLKSQALAALSKVDRRWYEKSVGGLWEEVGRLQFEFMKNNGLEPQHVLLDVGCGALRGGRLFVKYLAARNYYGVDADKRLLRAALHVVRKEELADKAPTLRKTADFEVRFGDVRFNYAIAVSVFTHMPLNSIHRCVLNVGKVLAPGGRFYATFFPNCKGSTYTLPIVHKGVDGDITSHMDRDPYHYVPTTFAGLCDGTDLQAKVIGDWGHPRGQHMVCFVKSSAHNNPQVDGA